MITIITMALNKSLKVIVITIITMALNKCHKVIMIIIIMALNKCQEVIMITMALNKCQEVIMITIMALKGAIRDFCNLLTVPRTVSKMCVQVARAHSCANHVIVSYKSVITITDLPTCLHLTILYRNRPAVSQTCLPIRICTEIGWQYGCTHIFLKIQIKSFKKYVNECEFVASKFNCLALIELLIVDIWIFEANPRTEVYGRS